MKAVSELFMPVSGEVLEVNEELNAAPEKINQDPYGIGLDASDSSRQSGRN